MLKYSIGHITGAVDLTGPMESPKGSHNTSQTPNKGPAQQITAAIIQQQNRAIAHQVCIKNKIFGQFS